MWSRDQKRERKSKGVREKSNRSGRAPSTRRRNLESRVPDKGEARGRGGGGKGRGSDAIGSRERDRTGRERKPRDDVDEGRERTEERVRARACERLMGVSDGSVDRKVSGLTTLTPRIAADRGLQMGLSAAPDVKRLQNGTWIAARTRKQMQIGERGRTCLRISLHVSVACPFDFRRAEAEQIFRPRLIKVGAVFNYLSGAPPSPSLFLSRRQEATVCVFGCLKAGD